MKKVVLYISGEKTIRIWNARTGIHELSIEGHTDAVNTASYSPDSKRIVSASEDKTIRLWDATTGRCLNKIEENDNVQSVCFSPNGESIVSITNKQICIWNARTGKCKYTLKKQRYGGGNFAFYSQDGKYIVSGSDDCSLCIWNIESGKCVKVLLHDSSVNAASASPKGKQIVSASSDKIYIWDMENFECIKIIKSHWGTVNSVGFSPDGMSIVSTTNDKISVWDIDTGMCYYVIDNDGKELIPSSFSPDGKFIISASGISIRIWNALPSLKTAVSKARERFKARILSQEEKKQYYLK